VGAPGRFALLGGASAGLAISPLIGPAPVPLLALAILAAAALALSATRPAAAAPRVGRWTWLGALAVAASLAGLLAGVARLEAIDGGAFAGEPGAPVRLRGFVTAVPRGEGGEVAVPIATADGRLLVQAREPVPDLRVGQEVAVTGIVREPEPWLAAHLAVSGIHRTVEAREVRPTARRRSGLAGLLDGIRERAEAALERNMPPSEAALARGFVLGQDDRIDPGTREDFRRSGLAHLLAVSGQNVILLVALAAPLLALLGVSLHARLACLVGLIAIYVPVAGAAPSIQRAGIMGAAGIAALLVSRPRSRWHIVLLAAAGTLALNPRAPADVGWQLSFAAVVGIIAWARPLAALARRALGGTTPATLDWRRAIAEGFGVTTAATLATAPLIAHSFEALPIASLPANLLALPAVAPVMWLGMLSAAAGQLPAVPVEPLNAVCALLIAYIEQVAYWTAAPAWSLPAVAPPGWALVAALYGGLLAAGVLAKLAARRRDGLGASPFAPSRRSSRSAPSRRLTASVLAAAAVATALGLTMGSGGRADVGAPPVLKVSFLDVGQGDAILIAPRGSDPVLVDGGPPGDGLAEELEDEGVERLAAAALTHEQSDQSGGLIEILDTVPVGALLHSGGAPDTRAAAAAASVPVRRLAEGDRARFGALRLDVLWPPESPSHRPADPNERSLVLLARWHGFSLLLTGDAEAEIAPLDPGALDVLKVAHHGSDDEGLPALLERAAPSLAVISVGAGNPYGHPAPQTLEALEAAEVPVLRTDFDGEVEVEVRPSGSWSAAPE
jgi:competence protein ComEC